MVVLIVKGLLKGRLWLQRCTISVDYVYTNQGACTFGCRIDLQPRFMLPQVEDHLLDIFLAEIKCDMCKGNQRCEPTVDSACMVVSCSSSSSPATHKVIVGLHLLG
jgi:hypothetical protein